MQESPETTMLDDSIDLRQYVTILVKWRWVIVAITLVSMLTAAALSFFVLPPVYETKVTLLVTQTSGQKTTREESGVEAVAESVSRLPEMTLNTYVGQIMSPYFLKQVAASPKLAASGLGARGLAGLVDARAIKDTSLIEVRVRNTDPQFAADIANTLSREFLDFISKNAEERMGKSVTFLQTQIDMVKKDLDEATARMEQMRTDASALDILQNDVTVSQQILAEARQRLMTVRAEQSLAQAGLEKARELLESYTAEKQSLGVVIGQEKDTKATIAALEATVNQREIELAEKTAQLAEVEAGISQIEEKIGEAQRLLVVKKTEYEQLAKQVAQLDETYRVLTDRMLQAQMARSMNIGDTNISVVSPAIIPETPVRPNKKLNIAVAGVLGLFVSVGLVFILEYLDNTIKSPEDVRRHLDLPTLGNIPLIQ